MRFALLHCFAMHWRDQFSFTYCLHFIAFLSTLPYFGLLHLPYLSYLPTLSTLTGFYLLVLFSPLLSTLTGIDRASTTVVIIVLGSNMRLWLFI